MAGCDTREWSRQLTHACVTVGQSSEDGATSRIRQGAEHRVKLGGGHLERDRYVTHWLYIAGRAAACQACAGVPVRNRGDR